jgi:hypothetical protein
VFGCIEPYGSLIFRCIWRYYKCLRNGK